jgi:nitroreductase
MSTRTADHPIAPHFLTRHSSRAFTDQPVTEAELLALFEAARWAPSASNNQPWRFAYALRGEPSFDAIVAGLIEFNQMWAPKAAALVVMASSDAITGADGVAKPNPWAVLDTGAAWGYFALQAHHQGLVAHAMGGIHADKLAQALHLPEGYTIHAAIGVGHQGPAESLPERMQKGEVPNGRHPLAHTVGHGRFV